MVSCFICRGSSFDGPSRGGGVRGGFMYEPIGRGARNAFGRPPPRGDFYPPHDGVGRNGSRGFYDCGPSPDERRYGLVNIVIYYTVTLITTSGRQRHVGSYFHVVCLALLKKIVCHPCLLPDFSPNFF